MSGWNAKYKNDFGEYEITFYSKDYEKTRAVEKVCCAIMDGKVKEAADVEPVRHGRWERSGHLMECQSCGEIYSQLGGNAGKAWNYCPNCGCKMDGENDG